MARFLEFFIQNFNHLFFNHLFLKMPKKNFLSRFFGSKRSERVARRPRGVRKWDFQLEHNFSKKSKNNRKFFFTLSWLVGARFEGNCEGVHLASSDLLFFTGNTIFLFSWHFLALFGYFPQFWSVFNETQDLSFFFKVMKNRGVVFPFFMFVCLLGWPQAFFFKKHRWRYFL